MLDLGCYEVRKIQSGFIVYRGPSISGAAYKLEPGTCYGQGPTPEAAHWNAEVAVREFQTRQQKPRVIDQERRTNGQQKKAR